MSLPLEGLTVVALEQAVAAPFCTSRLADAGARVIKVERREGDFARGYDRMAAGQSSYFVWLNRGKESIALDIKTKEDADLLRRMLAGADIFVQNLAPGAIERSGFGNDVLAELNPSLIQVNISGYGNIGPYRDRKAYDLLVQADAGLVSITGGPESGARVGISVCDIATGVHAYAAVLEAVIRRGIDGKGCVIDLSMFDALADWMTVPLLQAEATGKNPQRLGVNHASIAPYGAFRCGDGQEVVIAIQNEREWKSFCTDLLGDAEIAEDPRFADMVARVAHREELTRLIEDVFAGEDAENVMRRCEEARIAFAKVNTPLDLTAHPHLRRAPVATSGGQVDVVAPPVIRRGDENGPLAAVPAIDEHGAAIRREFANGSKAASQGDGRSRRRA